jgi:hypothetical protein
VIAVQSNGVYLPLKRWNADEALMGRQIIYSLGSFLKASLMTRERMNSAFATVFSALLLMPLSLHAREVQLPAGEYIREEGTGTLRLSDSTEKGIQFVLDTIGGNAHSCGLEGTITNRRAEADGLEEGKPCVVTFTRKGSSILIASSTDGACMMYCGMRATLDGRYLKPAHGCTSKELTRLRDRFKKLYIARNYESAYDLLEPALRRCSPTLHSLEAGPIRNDLAISLYHLGRYQDCRKTLQPLLSWYPRSEKELKDNLPPSDFDNHLPIAQATWHNAKLCSEQPEIRRGEVTGGTIRVNK